MKRANVVRMQREWVAQRDALAGFRLKLRVVLAQDYRRAHFKTSLADYCL
jgi:hypothetical protein